VFLDLLSRILQRIQMKRYLGHIGERGMELPCPLQVHHPPGTSTYSAIGKLFNPVLLAFHGDFIA
jgi:hypothetical protein